MKKVLLIEDELPALEKMKDLLVKSETAIHVAGTAMSVKEALTWLKHHPMPDLILSDIALSDGTSFDIFSTFPITCPVIFVTAYDEYWQEAFEYNSIDYLLKPVRPEKLASALARYEQLKEHFQTRFSALQEFGHGTDVWKKRFLVKRGTDLYSIPVADIAYFYAADKLVCLVDLQGQRFVLDQSLADIEKMLDPEIFNRVNRRFILHRNAIVKAKSYSKSKLLLEVRPSIQEEIIISQEYLSRFKAWFGN